METVDIILSHGIVLTMNDEGDVIRDGALAIRGTKLIAVGDSSDILARYHATEVVDCSGQYILPGLINAHTHVPMTLLRGLADDLRLDVWLMGYIMPVERQFVNPEFCRAGTRLACAEMIRGGVTTFADMYYYEADIAEVVAQIGMRAVLGETVLKFPAPDAETYEHGLDYARQFIAQWHGHELITPTVAPHAPYSNTELTLTKCLELARAYGVPILTHVAETQREVDDHLDAYNQAVVPWLEDLGLFDVPLLMAHGVHLTEQDMRLLAKRGVAVAHCPSANLKLASGIAPVEHLAALGVTVALGTDGPASNNDLDMFEEMRLAALIAKVQSHNPMAVPARMALQMATRNGAKALGLGAVTGTLEVGKFADVIVVTIDALHNAPQFDLNPDAVYSQLVYAVKSADVRHTMCHGRFLMRDRVLLTVDEGTIRAEASHFAREIDHFLNTREDSVLSKLIAVGVDVERAESFEIQFKARLDDPSRIQALLEHPTVEILRAVHYRQFDTYFVFGDVEKGRVRYREDDMLDAHGNVESVRMRLTYITGEKVRTFHDAVLLSHSRFIAPANQPLRFYQEYFQASDERSLSKDRLRWRILYKGVLFFVNLDQVLKPALEGHFVELKTRTWSLSDAEIKANAIREMMGILGIDASDAVREEYLDLVD